MDFSAFPHSGEQLVRRWVARSRLAVRRPRRFELALSLAALAVAFPARADFTCSTVTRSFLLDPDGATLSNSWGSEVGVNGSGGVVFVARVIGGKDKLYLYPGAGSPLTVASANGPSPNGGVFRATRPFADLSINDGNDVGFWGRLQVGQGVFVRPSGGPTKTAAVTTGTSPGGGAYLTFPHVSNVNSSGQVAFYATVSGGPSGVFLYDSGTDLTTVVLLNNDPTTGGREICSVDDLGLGDSGAVAIRAPSKVDCTNAGEPAVNGVFLDRGPIDAIAFIGDPTPIGGTTYSSFVLPPLVSSSDHVAFRGNVIGAVKTSAVFLSDFSGPTITKIVARGDSSPAGGGVGTIFSFAFANTDQVAIRANVSASAAKTGILEFGGAPATVVVRSSTPPTDLFGVGTTYSSFSNPSIAADASHAATIVRVHDTVSPGSKHGVEVCVP